MEQQIINIPVNIRFDSARLLDFHVTDYAKSLKDLISPFKYECVFTPSHLLDHEAKTLNVSISVEIFNLETKDKMGHINTSFTFYISNFSELVTIDNNGQEIIFAPLLPMVFGICLSTTRGMCLMACLGTKISNLILPVVDIGKMFSVKQPEK